VDVRQSEIPLARLRHLEEMADYLIPFAVRVVGDFAIADAFAAGPRAVAEVADELSLHPGALERVLRALSTKDIFAEVEPGVFGLTPMADLLRGEHPHSLQGTFPLMPDDVQAWAYTAHSIRTGECGFTHVHGCDYYDYFVDKPEECARFDRSVQTLHLLMVRTLLPAYDWGSLDTLVDVGSGNGAFTAELLARHPHLSATLFDLPHVIARTEPELAKAGVAERATSVGGDFFQAVPAGADAYLLKTILHDWDTPRAQRIVQSVAAAMRPDSRMIILEAVPLPGDAYDIGKVMDVKQLVLFGGHARTEAEFDALFARAGLRRTAVIRTPTLVIVEARPAGYEPPPQSVDQAAAGDRPRQRSARAGGRRDARPGRSGVDIAAMLRLIDLTDYIVPHTVRSIADIGVADALRDGPRRVEDLAEAVGADPAALLRALRALACHGLFTEVSEGRFGLTELAQLLRTDHPHSARGALPMMPAELEAWAGYHETMRTGAPAFPRVHGRSWAEHLAGHHRDRERAAAARCHAARLELTEALRVYPWSELATVVDLGGADGFADGLRAAHPHLRVAPGSVPTGELPSGAGAYVMRHTLYTMDCASATETVRTVRAAMDHGGRLLVLEPVRGTDPSGAAAARADLFQLVFTGGRIRDRAELVRLLASGGLRVARVFDTEAGPLLEAVPDTGSEKG
jgi:SAM-dependent methyltransferase